MANKSRNIETNDGEGSTVDAFNDEVPLDMWMKNMGEMLEKCKVKDEEELLRDINWDKESQTTTSDDEPHNVDENYKPAANEEAANHEVVMSTEDEKQMTALQDCIENFLHTCNIVQKFSNFSSLKDEVPVVSLVTGIIAFEGINRIDNHLRLTDGPIRMYSALVYLQRALVMSQSLQYPPVKIPLNLNVNILNRILRGLLIGDNTISILGKNMFITFVSLFNHGMILRKEGQNSKMNYEKHLLRICTVAQLVQIILQLDYEKLSTNPDTDMDSNDEITTGEIPLFQRIYSFAGIGDFPAGISHHKLVTAVRMSMLPYLRWCALYLHLVTKVPPPSTKFDIASFDVLMTYLGLPKTIVDLVDRSLEPLIKSWCENPDYQRHRLKKLPPKLRYPKVCEVPNLVDLPRDYSDLLEEAAEFACPKFDSEDLLCPTMCLVCRKVVCSQNFCCQEIINGKTVGACNAHSHECGDGVGIFLRIRECSCILLDSLKRGTYATAPYLDKYGEADKGLRRGNPLHLNENQLHMARKLWLSHMIPERISHDVESRDAYWLDWAHL